jgi:hypothetical protein
VQTPLNHWGKPSGVANLRINRPVTIHRNNRRGAVLVQFALLTFGILALAALVIDLGFVRLTRLQMLSAADSAAVEALRFRDELPPESMAGSDLETERRQAASRLASFVFDDDFDAGNGDAVNHGAGPVVEFSDGIALSGTAYRASQLITVPDPPVYDPTLRLNLANSPEGDMVAGTYLDGPSVVHEEQSDYSRDDFDPAGTRDAFLVRMRRTNESFASGSDTSSGGPAIPYLFARGSLLGFDNRAQGVTVRGTAIGAARRVKTVGRADPTQSPPLSGAAPLVLRRSVWESPSLATDVPATLTITVGSSDVMIGAAIAGHFFDLDNLASVQIGHDAAPVLATPARIAELPITGRAYAAIVADSGALANRVIGFGFVDVSRDPGNLTAVTLTKRTNRIAARNASTAIVDPLPIAFSDQPNDSDLTELFESHCGSTAFSDPLLGAASVR